MTEASAKAPNIVLEAAVSGRTLQLDDPGQPTLLLLVAQESAGQVDPVVEAVRAVYPDTAQMRIATIIDGRKFPKLIRPVAEAMLKSRYNDEAKKLEPGQDPADWIFMIPDWDARAMTELQISDVGQTIAVASVASDGSLYGPYQGDDATNTALQFCEMASGASG